MRFKRVPNYEEMFKESNKPEMRVYMDIYNQQSRKSAAQRYYEKNVKKSSN